MNDDLRDFLAETVAFLNSRSAQDGAATMQDVTVVAGGFPVAPEAPAAAPVDRDEAMPADPEGEKWTKQAAAETSALVRALRDARDARADAVRLCIERDEAIRLLRLMQTAAAGNHCGLRVVDDFLVRYPDAATPAPSPAPGGAREPARDLAHSFLHYRGNECVSTLMPDRAAQPEVDLLKVAATARFDDDARSLAALRAERDEARSLLAETRSQFLKLKLARAAQPSDARTSDPATWDGMTSVLVADAVAARDAMFARWLEFLNDNELAQRVRDHSWLRDLERLDGDTKKRDPGCKCHLEEGDSECPVHDAALEGAVKAVPRGHCNRCDRCGWEMGEGEARASCRPEDCSMRPLPPYRLSCAGCGATYADGDRGKETT